MKTSIIADFVSVVMFEKSFILRPMVNFEKSYDVPETLVYTYIFLFRAT